MSMAFFEGRFSQAQIARHLGVHSSTVSRAVRENRKRS
jgi:IS30 family transposase